MEIEYKGGNGLLLKTGGVTIAVDPQLSSLGLKDIKVDDATIELTTEPRFIVESAKPKLLIEGPGEYEISNISIKGVEATRHIDETGNTSTVYSLTIAGIRLAILGNIKPDLSEDQLESIGIIDVAVIPVGGGGYTLDAHAAAAVARQLDPKIVIPVHYADKEVNYEVPQDDLESFLKEFGASEHEAVDKFKLKVGATLPAVLTIVEIKRS